LRIPVTMQPAFSNNSLQVIDVGDVIDGRHALMVTDGPVVRFLRLRLKSNTETLSSSLFSPRLSEIAA
jgi:hypothetical protein